MLIRRAYVEDGVQNRTEVTGNGQLQRPEHLSADSLRRRPAARGRDSLRKGVSITGTDDLDNLSLACIDCNLHKRTNLTGIDPETNAVTDLFHPQRHNWDEHFGWRGIYLMGKTAIGRAIEFSTSIPRTRSRCVLPDSSTQPRSPLLTIQRGESQIRISDYASI